MKKISPFIMAIILSVGIVAALWLVGPTMTGAAIFKVKSDKTNISIVKNLIGGDFDTTLSNVSFTDEIIIDSNRKQDYIVDLDIIKIDDGSDSCTDYLNDCDVSAYFDYVSYGYDTPLEDGSVISLEKGLNYINLYGECQQFTCPQNISVMVNMTVLE